MIEIVRGRGGECSFGCAGDTLNIAVYMARLGLKPSYVTALGEDPFSEDMVAFCRDEGLASIWLCCVAISCRASTLCRPTNAASCSSTTGVTTPPPGLFSEWRQTTLS